MELDPVTSNPGNDLIKIVLFSDLDKAHNCIINIRKRIHESKKNILTRSALKW